MPAVTVHDPIVLPRIGRPDLTHGVRPVDDVISAQHAVEIVDAIDDFNAGRMGTIPAHVL